MSASDIAKLFRRFDALEERVIAMEGRIGGGPQSAADDTRFQAALADLALTMRTNIEATVEASKEELKTLLKAVAAAPAASVAPVVASRRQGRPEPSIPEPVPEDA
jgi:hypothetical protein